METTDAKIVAGTERFDAGRVRADFPILARQVYGRPLVYLDNAATAQKPRQVVERMSEFMLDSNGNIHRGAHRLSDEATAAYEAARQRVAEFIGAPDGDCVIFTSGATAGLNTAAHSLVRLLVERGDNIVVSEMEHHANIVPWQLATAASGSAVGCGSDSGSASGPGRAVNPDGVEIRVLPFDDDGRLETDRLESLIDSCTKILAITQCSNVLGTRPDIKVASEIAHRHGITVVVDGCQGVVHDGGNAQKIAESGADIYAFSGHKLYGPTGIGVLWGRRELLEKMPPFLAGGDMVDRVSLQNGTTFAQLPFKFEAGTTNFVGAVGLAAAIDYLRRFDPGDIDRHETMLLEAATKELLKIDGLRIYGTTPGKAPIVSFTVEGTHPADIGAILDKQGVAIRTGTHCAQPLMARFGVQTMCRASFAFYNTMEEVEKLAFAVKKATRMLRG